MTPEKLATLICNELHEFGVDFLGEVGAEEHIAKTIKEHMTQALLSEAEIEKIVTNAIRANSSPMLGKGDIHGGQAGWIIYEKDGLPFVIGDIARALRGYEQRLNK